MTATRQTPRLDEFNRLTGLSLTAEQARDLIVRAAAHVLDIDVSALARNTQSTELDLDSVVLIEILLEVEEMLDVEFPTELLAVLDEDAPEIETLEQLLALLVS